MPDWMRRLDASLLTERERLTAARLAAFDRLIDELDARHRRATCPRRLVCLQGGLS